MRPPPFAEGDRIELVKMGEDDPCPIPAGAQGTVTGVCPGIRDHTWQVSVKWDIARSLALVVPPDIAVKIG